MKRCMPPLRNMHLSIEEISSWPEYSNPIIF